MLSNSHSFGSLRTVEQNVASLIRLAIYRFLDGVSLESWRIERRNRSLPCFPISWTRYFPESIGQQDFSADRFKAVATSHTLGQLHPPIQTLGISGSVTVGEVVVKNGVSVVLNC